MADTADMPERIGDYRIEAKLGAGGMATVYRARHTVLDTLHAIKVLDPAYRVRPEARQRFLDEARIQAKHLDHPNIVKVTNIVATPEHAALVMELASAGNLEAELHALVDRPDEIRRIMLAVLDAVGHAHAAGIIHRDLKPANVLLARKDGVLIPKVTDFGIAKVAAEVAGKGKRSTHGDARMGTLGYMSPEQVRRAKDVTVRSDIFSLGAMLYELATGEQPFTGESDYDVMESVVNGRYPDPAAIHEGIDPGIAAVIRRALALDPADRYASCAEMAAALRDGDEGGRRKAPETGAGGGRRRAIAIAAIAVVGLALGTGALLLASRERPPGGVVVATLDASSPPGSLAADAGVAATFPRDASARVVPLFSADGGRLGELHAGAAALVDASPRSRLAALLTDPPVDASVPAPPPPNPCRGTWFFTPGGEDWTIAVTARTSGTCGEHYFYDRGAGFPVRTCHAALRNCRVDGKVVTASFDCTFNRGTVERRQGTVRLTCGGGRVTARSPYGSRTAN
jgi:hypothetical protein